MSRLTSRRANAPMRGITKKSGFKGWRKKSLAWREGEPLLVVRPLVSAFREAVRHRREGLADTLAGAAMRRMAGCFSKPRLMAVITALENSKRFAV